MFRLLVSSLLLMSLLQTGKIDPSCKIVPEVIFHERQTMKSESGGSKAETLDLRPQTLDFRFQPSIHQLYRQVKREEICLQVFSNQPKFIDSSGYMYRAMAFFSS